jgi:hypothetical protein
LRSILPQDVFDFCLVRVFFFFFIPEHKADLGISPRESWTRKGLRKGEKERVGRPT